MEAMPTDGRVDWVLLASLAALVAVLAASVYMEVRDRRIPNVITMAGVVAGLAAGYLPGGATLGSSLLGLAIGFGALLAFYVFGGMGGGDVKLMGAVGAMVGFPLIVPVLFYSAIIGGLMAIAVLASRGDVWRYGWHAARTAFGAAGGAEPPARPASVTVPYGLAIAAGALLALGVG